MGRNEQTLDATFWEQTSPVFLIREGLKNDSFIGTTFYNHWNFTNASETIVFDKLGN